MSNLREDRRAEASSGRATEDQAEQRITRQLDEARGIARTMAQNGGNGSVIYGALSKMPRFKDLPQGRLMRSIQEATDDTAVARNGPAEPRQPRDRNVTDAGHG